MSSRIDLRSRFHFLNLRLDNFGNIDSESVFDLRVLKHGDGGSLNRSISEVKNKSVGV